MSTATQIPAKWTHVETKYNQARGGKNKGKKILTVSIQCELPTDFKQGGQGPLLSFMELAGIRVTQAANDTVNPLYKD